MRDKEARIMVMRLIGVLTEKGVVEEKDYDEIFGEPKIIKMDKEA